MRATLPTHFTVGKEGRHKIHFSFFSDRTSNIFPQYVPGPAGDAESLETVEEFWEILFNKEMIDIIVEETNKKIQEVCTPLIVEDKVESYHHHTDAEEIRAYDGVIYYSGLWKAANVDVHRLWDMKSGIIMYRCAFSKQRFVFLSSCLRFDDKHLRDENDRFSPIRKLWDIFISNCTKYYTPSSKCTVDEQLLSFRGRCIFRMYMKDKPDKYGLEIITLNDAETSYLVHINCFV